jgi:hypothetical protein
MRVRARCVRRRAEVAHQLSHTPQVDSIFNVPAGKDNLLVRQGLRVAVCGSSVRGVRLLFAAGRFFAGDVSGSLWVQNACRGLADRRLVC